MNSAIRTNMDAKNNNPNNPRPSWDEYFMNIAGIVSSRSTCLRRQIGAIIVRDKKILSTGYNGAASKIRHCLDIGCLREKLSIPSGERHEICRAIHAEQNAIIQAAISGTSIKDAIIYCTARPCSLCAKMIINAGIRCIVYKGDYPDDLAVEMLNEAGVEMIRFNVGEHQTD